MYQTITVETDARGVATLQLDRPEKHNAMSADMLAELTQAAQRLGDDDGVRVVVLTAAGKSFCAGGDLAWMKAQMEADAEQRGAEALRLATMLQAFDTLPKPLIGALQGNAFGGGVGLACVCDVAIGADHINMGLTEVRLGLIPATIGPYVVSRMGPARARRVFFSGRIFKAPEAVELGVLSRVAPADQLDAAIEAEIRPYLSAAPGAVAAGKRLVAELGGRVSDQMIDHTIGQLVACWNGGEASEGISAFFDKRDPYWKDGG